MSFQLIKIDGLFRRVTERSAEAGGLRVTVIVGFRERRSVASKSPGPGWRLVPGEKRIWLKREPRTEERFAENSAVVEMTAWPTGVTEHGFTAEHYDHILKPSIDAGVEATGAIGKRQAPDLKVETLEASIKEAGLPMPTAEEFTKMVKTIWERDHRPKPRPQNPSSAAVVGRKAKTPAEKRAEAEAARLADEALAAEATRLAEEVKADEARLVESASLAEEILKSQSGETEFTVEAAIGNTNTDS